MGCKHRKVQGNTTKYFVCGITGKAIDEYKCKNCMLKIEDKNDNFKEMFENIFGKGFMN